jgi:hypothetical protein
MADAKKKSDSEAGRYKFEHEHAATSGYASDICDAAYVEILRVPVGTGTLRMTFSANG